MIMKSSTSRRLFLGAAAAAALTVGLHKPASAAETAADFIRRLGGQLVGIINSDLPATQKKSRIDTLIQYGVDVPEIGRFCLGRYWRTATPAEQTQYMTLFRQILVNSVSDRLGDYRGVSFTITGSAPDGENQAVTSVLHRPQQPDANVRWVVSTASGAPKVIDMVGEGASLRLTQRQDYASFIQRNGGQVGPLLAALQHQLERHNAGQ